MSRRRRVVAVRRVMVVMVVMVVKGRSPQKVRWKVGITFFGEVRTKAVRTTLRVNSKILLYISGAAAPKVARKSARRGMTSPEARKKLFTTKQVPEGKRGEARRKPTATVSKPPEPEPERKEPARKEPARKELDRSNADRGMYSSILVIIDLNISFNHG